MRTGPGKDQSRGKFARRWVLLDKFGHKLLFAKAQLLEGSMMVGLPDNQVKLGGAPTAVF